MEGDKPTTVTCTVLGMARTNFCYRVCSVCERTLSDNPSSLCKFCNFNSNNTYSSSNRLFRLLVSSPPCCLMMIQCGYLYKLTMGMIFEQISIATDTKVKVVTCFDRAARVFFATTASKVLQRQMFRMTLSKPKNGNAQHLRVSSVVPLSSSYRPTIETLREIYGVSIGS
ncbi:hypothetical protein EZV62_002365 [Acer yangbiense]|uniref:Replication factor A C-terminal domain-containing protein n=1 Tax=Acer yangbiense TaxID=1000413 RepID=A0A5C7IZA3_9ROSI|nr:hypothetical protein EZV62_002365 [Acer yangbiense]